jgi:hypothetical protein
MDPGRAPRHGAGMSTTATLTTRITSRPLLRLALEIDALVTGANGLAYLVLAAPLGDLFDVSAPLLRGIGAFLLVFAAGVYAVSRREPIPAGPVRAVVALNVAWAIASLVVAIGGWEDPSTAGTVWTVLQALVVAGFAELQLTGLRRATAR